MAYETAMQSSTRYQDMATVAAVGDPASTSGNEGGIQSPQQLLGTPQEGTTTRDLARENLPAPKMDQNASFVAVSTHLGNALHGALNAVIVPKRATSILYVVLG